MRTLQQLLANPLCLKTPEEQAIYERYMMTNTFSASVVSAEEAAKEQNASKTKQIGGDHYSKLAIEPGDYAEANNLSFYQGNVIKYVTRYKDKGGVADLNKAKHCIDKLLEIEENKIKKLIKDVEKIDP